MDFNTFLIRFGLDPEQFTDCPTEPIKTGEDYIFEIVQKREIIECPFCSSKRIYIKDHDVITINATINSKSKDILRIKKTRYKCRDCKKSFTPELRGIKKYNKTTDQIKDLLKNDFTTKCTFTELANKYNISQSECLYLFDKMVPFVPRRELDEVICIDEIKFDDRAFNKYIAVISSFNKKEIIDMVESRKIEYLRKYFKKIDENERNNVKVFISDMYDPYYQVRKELFKSAIHIIDLFHVITQLNTVVNKIRSLTMNLTSKDSIEYKFMKKRWQFFLCRKKDIPDKFFKTKNTYEEEHYDDLIFKCIQLNEDLYDGYNCLQELFEYNSYENIEEAKNFVRRIIQKLRGTKNASLHKVADTYERWILEISNGLLKECREKKYSNSIAEGINNHLKSIKKAAYGYHNFERFRKRGMLIMTYSKRD